MSISDELLDELSDALSDVVSPGLTNANSVSDLYEGYILGLVIVAARKERAKITYFDSSETVTSDFVFRTSPGFIWSSTKPYTFAKIEFKDVAPLEAHIGVRIAGKSKVLHELDVCVLRHSEGQLCRRNKVHPRQANVLFGVECKFYTSNLGLHLARSFLGLGTDTSSKNNFFVTNTGSKSVEKLLSARNRKWGSKIYPKSNTDVERLRNEFQTAFKDYKALNLI